MSESFRTTPSDQPWSGSANPGNGYQGGYGDDPPKTTPAKPGKSCWSAFSAACFQRPAI